MMMAVRPELVAMDRIPLAKSNSTPDGDVVGGGVYRWRTIGSRSAIAASSAIRRRRQRRKGERLFDAISTALADKLCDTDLWELPWKAEQMR